MIKIEEYGFLRNVEKPSRYTGGELYETVKDDCGTLVRAAIAFPEVYDIGMSNVGLQILYNILNNQPDIWAERVFMPLPDMEEELRKREIPLYGLESGRALNGFDVVGFSLQYELTYTNVLAMLSLGKIPLRSERRNDGDPVVIAGGPSAINPEPMSAFIDAFFIGDGEEGFVEICRSLKASKGKPRSERLVALSKIEGIYVPSLYEKEIDPKSGRVFVGKPRVPEHPFPVKRRIIADLGKFAFPLKPVIPNHEIVHDRFSYEIARGCNVGCRFCEAGFYYRPVRNRGRSTVMNDLVEVERTTGYDGASLLSLSTGDYPEVDSLLMEIKETFGTEDYTLTLPSLRVTSLKPEILDSFSRKKKMAFTIAPEAGSQRLRNVINKKISEDEIREAAETLFSYGWSSLKLYFMLGLPTETEEDVRAIAAVAKMIASIGKQKGVKKLSVSVSTSSFIPKPFTPFQWEHVAAKEDLRLKQDWLKNNLKSPVSYKWHKIDASMLEAVFSRGDSRLCDVLEKAFEQGCRLDGWTEHFKFEEWRQAFSACGLDFDSLVHAKFEEDSPLPWDVIDLGVKKEFFKRERKNAFDEKLTDTCSGSHCFSCGDFRGLCRNLEEAVPEEKTERRTALRALPGEAKWYRAKFRKSSPLHLVGHLDFVKNVSKGFRRAGIKLEYTEGFHPFPKMEIVSPLPLGVEGEEELMDFKAFPFETSAPASALNDVLPEGVRFLSVIERMPDERHLCDFTVHHYELDMRAFTDDELKDITGRTEEFIASDSLVVTAIKKGEKKETDIRKKLLGAKINGCVIELELLNGGLNKVLEVIVPKEESHKIRAKRKFLSIP